VVTLPQTLDPTLEAADRALEAAQQRRGRPYLGMSAIGAECARQLWYGFRWVRPQSFDAATLKRFADGHATEAVAIARLRAVESLEVHDVGEDGRQFGFVDIGEHFRGHMDGVILGLLQAPTTWHVLEIKATAEKKLAELEKARTELGEKHALRAWNPIYYAQAVLYMDYAGLDRHYLVACSPGGRKWASIRTDADPVEAARLRAKAERIIYAARPPERIGGPDSFACRWCDFATLCHSPTEEGAVRNCRTCLHVTPQAEGGWSCARWAALDLDEAQQTEGCPRHLFIPDLVPFEQIDAVEDRVTYRRPDGTLWVDGGGE
jgi:hypothetical protein